MFVFISYIKGEKELFICFSMTFLKLRALFVQHSEYGSGSETQVKISKLENYNIFPLSLILSGPDGNPCKDSPTKQEKNWANHELFSLISWDQCSGSGSGSAWINNYLVSRIRIRLVITQNMEKMFLKNELILIKFFIISHTTPYTFSKLEVFKTIFALK